MNRKKGKQTEPEGLGEPKNGDVIARGGHLSKILAKQSRRAGLQAAWSKCLDRHSRSVISSGATSPDRVFQGSPAALPTHDCSSSSWRLSDVAVCPLRQ
jgi:hypothetical protein